MKDVDTELSILEEKLAELREESTRRKNFQSSMHVTTRMDSRVKDSAGGEAHFSDEFQERGKSPTLNSEPGKHTKTSTEKPTEQYLRGTYIDAEASPCVYPFPNLIFSRKKKK